MSKRGENIYKRKDGRWEGRYIKCRTPHGKIQYGYVYGKSYSEVKSKLKETTPMPIQTSNSQVPQPTSYNEILKMWLLSAKNHVKESTFSRYNHLVERHIQPFLGGYQIGEISNALAKEHHDKLYGGKTLEEATSPEMLDGQAASVVPLDNDVEFSDSNVPPEDPKVEKTDIDVQGDFPEKDNIVTRGNRDKKGIWGRLLGKM